MLHASIRIVALTALGLFAGVTAFAQPGTILSHRVISDSLGNFNQTLDDFDEFGGAIVGLGDLDGAGPSVAAFAAGAPSDDDGGSTRGAVYVLFLDAAGAILSTQKISSLQGNFTGALDNSDEFGGAIAHLGDLDGAGPSATAIAVGAPGDDDGGSGRGAIYVLFLTNTGTVLSYRKISATLGLTGQLDDGDEFGASAAGLGDLDGAGASVGAVAVGSGRDDDGGTDCGAVYVLFLNATGTMASFQKISETQGGFTGALDSSDDFGAATTALGDLDGTGPGVAALAVGTQGDDDGGSARGAVYVLNLTNAGTVLSHTKIAHAQGGFTGTLDNSDEFGASVSHLGDLDGPGSSATVLAIGSPGDDDGGLNRGATYLLFLGNSGAAQSHVKLSAASGVLSTAVMNEDAFGVAVAALGDIDGPGGARQTIAIGATGDDDAGEDRGGVHLLGLDGLATTAVSIPSPMSPNALGAARPNPFVPRTHIPFRITNPARVEIDIWDLSGRRVRTLFRDVAAAGEHHVVWDGCDARGRRLSAGAYLYRMTLDGIAGTESRQVVLLR